MLARVSKHMRRGSHFDSLIKRMLALKHFRDGFNGTSCAFYAAYDLALHSGSPSVDPLRSGTSYPRLEAIEMEGTSAVGHLMSGYDAGYYGYLWSGVRAGSLHASPRKGR